ncbi:MAG: hypothetical protein J0L75_06365 [Spirochaetes bacterium]|nr:hypothetical protein [Spirochaetota bacterium]
MPQPIHIAPKVQHLHETLKQIHEKMAHRTAGFYQDMEGFFHVNHGRHLAEIRAICTEIEGHCQQQAERLMKILAEFREEGPLAERTLAFIDQDLAKLQKAIGALSPYLPKLNFSDASLAQRSSREITALFLSIPETRAFLANRAPAEAPAAPPPKLEILPPDPDNLYHKDERKKLGLDKEALQKQVGKDLDAIDLILYVQEKLRKDMETHDNGMLQKLVASVGTRLSILLFKKTVTQEELVRHGILSKELPKLAIRHFNDKNHYSLGAILIYVSDFAAILADMRERAYAHHQRDGLQFETLKSKAMETLVSLALLTEDPPVLDASLGRLDTVTLIKKLYALFNEMSGVFSKSGYAQAVEIRTSFSYLGKSLADFKAELTHP